MDKPKAKPTSAGAQKARRQSRREAIGSQLDDLVEKGNDLLTAMVLDCTSGEDGLREKIKRLKGPLPIFHDEYEGWYSSALPVVRQLLPDRLDDFIAQYKIDRRKSITYTTYTVSDYLLSITVGNAGPDAACPKLKKQTLIVRAAREVLDGVLADISGVLQAELFDGELQAAGELAKHGFARAAGAMSGVVLERHLAHVCAEHGLASRKKSPTINDFNELLKGDQVVDVPTWRFIQHLGDLRNLCDHPKEREPEKQDALDLIEGTAKVSKTVF